MINVNYAAIIVAAIINMALGTVWYGPLFGKQWTKLMGWTKEDMEKGKGMMPRTYAFAFLSSFVMAYVFAHFISVGSAMTAMEGAVIGFWLWLGFIATTTANDVLFGRNKFNLYLLQNGYYLVLLLINGAILAVWR